MSDLKELKEKLKKVIFLNLEFRMKVHCLPEGEKKVEVTPPDCNFEVNAKTGEIYYPAINALLKAIEEIEE
jgi:hypothetical protein